MNKRRITSWSFSALQVFESCKYHSKLARLDKVPDLQPKTAADRGTAIHQEAEDYVTGKGPFTNNLRFFKDDLTALAVHFSAGRVVCEQEWGFDTRWHMLSGEPRGSGLSVTQYVSLAKHMLSSLITKPANDSEMK